ncbi:ABC transporter substrate-binding protein [Methanocorpusculum vombati]|uniref:ABC transporter substrate-binding protein n=1 Tax=Methanocorpusculum vombati TaxID=3002864 RepID=A0ABT4IMM8_9EURY|nr:ABC transporter substrate-binding protein [Methanocorpusculum vombati]MDE2521402.1 ABC transporter substrate-binding protein [Methanocorpusculum sp.]MCZ0862497.1 ABC transporter substrate-binding protein [Methanocorpusculum vombati]MDE2533888.1 ABC transporter substrate-binding protein [Methanocorpusculum sp.]MDE2546777.1 ABC transporter substrate-binding protein [Methanocorpusculum sp.]MDE2548041.1 ABC transporter substrate-binding protein [Methanocorpusculum sp.]
MDRGWKNYSLLGITCMILLICCISSGCVGTTGTENTGDTITITDAAGREVTIPDNPQKIAVSGSGALRYFVYLNVELDRVVIVDYGDSMLNKPSREMRPYIHAHPEIQTIPALGSQTHEVDPEKLLSSGADVLFLSMFTATRENADEIQDKTGIPVVMFYTGDYITDKDKIQDTFRMIGKIFHKEQRTEDLIAYFDSITTDLQSRIPNISEDAKPTVYIGGVSYRGSHGMDGTNPYYYPFTILEAKNIVSGYGTSESIGYVQIAKEQLLAWDPDIIFVDLATIQAAEGGAVTELKNDPSYRNMKAVRNGDVYTVNPHTSYVVNYETTLANAYYVGKILYPEQFADIDPEQKADEIYTYVVGAPVYEQLKEDVNGLSYQKLEL